MASSSLDDPTRTLAFVEPPFLLRPERGPEWTIVCSRSAAPSSQRRNQCNQFTSPFLIASEEISSTPKYPTNPGRSARPKKMKGHQQWQM